MAGVGHLLVRPAGHGDVEPVRTTQPGELVDGEDHLAVGVEEAEPADAGAVAAGLRVHVRDRPLVDGGWSSGRVGCGAAVR